MFARSRESSAGQIGIGRIQSITKTRPVGRPPPENRCLAALLRFAQQRGGEILTVERYACGRFDSSDGIQRPVHIQRAEHGSAILLSKFWDFVGCYGMFFLEQIAPSIQHFHRDAAIKIKYGAFL